jgi:hypothetical protein
MANHETNRGAMESARRGARRVRNEVKEMIGGLLRDEAMVREGELRDEQLDMEERARRESERASRRARLAQVRIREAELAAERVRVAAASDVAADRARVARHHDARCEQIDADRARQSAEGAVREHLLRDSIRRAEDGATRDLRHEQLEADEAARIAAQARRRAQDAGVDTSSGREPDREEQP